MVETAAGPLCGATRSGSDCQRRRHGHVLKPLTWAFAPLAGLEPAPYGLEVRHHPSAWWCLGLSLQVALGPPSGRSYPSRSSYSDRIAREIATQRGPLHSLGSRWLGQAADRRTVSARLFAPERRHRWTAVAGRAVAVTGNARRAAESSGNGHTIKAGWFHSRNGALSRQRCGSVVLWWLTCWCGCCRAGYEPQPERSLGWLHGLVDHGVQLGRERVQVDLVAESVTERLDGLGGVVAAVEASVDRLLDAAASRLDQSGHGQGGAGDDPAGRLVRNPTKQLPER
jgi:hypothetical protein